MSEERQAGLTRDETSEHLAKTSRTFALAIPLLPEPTRFTVSLSYLLFRIADTLEDAATWSADLRAEALQEFADLVISPDPARAESVSRKWIDAKPTEHAGYLALLERTPAALASIEALAPEVAAIVRDHVVRTALGMRNFVAHAEGGNVHLNNVRELQEYCYVVAGIVGELLTATFLHDAPAIQCEAGALIENQRSFGEALQLVNILKDQHDDAKDGRTFLPASVTRDEVIALVREDLASAHLYNEALKRSGAPNGFVAFTGLPYDLASLTLAQLEADGPGAKVPRERVMKIFQDYLALAAV